MTKVIKPLTSENARLNISATPKATFFSQAPDCLRIEGGFLGNDIVPLSKTSKTLHTFFKPQLLLFYVAYGKEKLVEQMLEKEPMLLLKITPVTDFAGRYFHRITAYQYALWAGDMLIVRIIEHIASKVKGAQGENLRAALLVQWKTLQEMKISYTLNGNIYHEAAYNPEPLFKAYRSYIFQYNKLNGDKVKLKEIWPQGVGIQQKLMPVHGIFELGYQSAVYKRLLQIYNPLTEKTDFELCTLASQEKGLGFSFAIIRAERKDCEASIYVTVEEAELDLKTLSAFFKTIKKEQMVEPAKRENPDQCLPCVIL